MAHSIYDKFLTISDCKYYCNQVARKLNLKTHDYFFDKYSELQFPGDSNVRAFDAFKYYDDWQIKFNLTKPKTIMRVGLEEYVSNKHELVFNLTIKGFSFLYVCKFFNPNSNENNIISGVLDNNTNTIYIEDKETGQLSFII